MRFSILVRRRSRSSKSMNKWFKLLVAALIIISAGIQAKQFEYGHIAVPVATIVLQLLVLVLLVGNEIRQSRPESARPGYGG